MARPCLVPSAGPSPFVGLRIPAPNLERLDRLARLRGVPRSVAIRDAVALYLDTVDPDPEEAAASLI